MGTDAALQSIPSNPHLWLLNRCKNVTCSGGTFSGAGSLSSSTANPWFLTKSMSSFLFPAQNTAPLISTSSSLGSSRSLAGLDSLLKKCSGGPSLMAIQNFWSNRVLWLELMGKKRRQILLCDLHGLHLQFLCKPDPEGAFAHACWENMRPQWQMGVGGSIGQSILPVCQVSSWNGGFVPFSIVFLRVGEEAPVKKHLGFSTLKKDSWWIFQKTFLRQQKNSG